MAKSGVAAMKVVKAKTAAQAKAKKKQGLCPADQG